MKRTKAHTLPLSTRQAIAAKKDKNRKMTFTELATLFNCTYDQARHAWLQYQDGRFGQTKRRHKRIPRADGRGFDDLINEQVQSALLQLEDEDSKISVMERVQCIERLVSAKKMLLQISVAGHLRLRDAELISDLIRRYEPEATAERIITIVTEVRETVR